MIRRSVAAAILIIAASIGLKVVAQATDDTNRLISVYDQGVEHSFITQEKTIGAALETAGIALDERDSVEPSRNEELVADTYQVNIYRARPIIVVDGAVRLKILSAHQSPALIAEDAGLPLKDSDTADFSLADNLLSDGAGQVLTITRARDITIDLYGTMTPLRTQANTVEELLREKNITLDDNTDRISIPLSTLVTDDMSFRIWREGIQTLSTQEEIAPAVRIIYDLNQPLGYRAVQTKGVVGLRTLTYQVEIRDGKEVSRIHLSTVTTREPKEQTEVIGLRNDGRGLTAAKGAQYFTDSRGISHRETYYDLPMNVVMGACGQGGYYTVRPDGAKVDRDGYVIIAANYSNYPRCSVVETSLGPGKVYDTGGFAARHPHGFDLATDWTNRNGR